MAGEPTSVDVQALQQAVSRLTLEAAKYAQAQRLQAAEVAAAARSVKRQKLIVAGVVVAVVALLVATSLVVVLLVRQSCINDRSSRFFAAERAKVSGQVKGLDEMQTAAGDQAKALAGFNQFKHASEHYLEVIRGLPTC